MVSNSNSPILDQFDLERFIIAQKGLYNNVLSELKLGQKRTHWMWYIFPQLDGLGKSTTSRLFAIKSIKEAQCYLNHPILGLRLLECTETVFDIEGHSISEIFKSPDDIKFRSSMTLYDHISKPSNNFSLVLEKYFDGNKDEETLKILDGLKSKGI